MKRISFRPELSRAIREDRKSCTRRIAKDPHFGIPPEWTDHIVEKNGVFVGYGDDPRSESGRWVPKYKVSEIVGVAEPWFAAEGWNGHSGAELVAKGLPASQVRYIADRPDGKPPGYCRFRQARYLPDAFVRTCIRMTGVEVQRVQEISEDDILAEGVRYPVMDGRPVFRLTGPHKPSHYWPVSTWNEMKVRPDLEFHLLRSEFAALWDSIHATPSPIFETIDGKKRIVSYECFPWDEPDIIPLQYRGKPLVTYPNPWVFVYRFERVKEGS